MNVNEVVNNVPEGSGAVVVLSGGMDSAVSARVCVERFGREKVKAITFDYNQKQVIEIEKAREVTDMLGIAHKVFDLSILGDISKGFSSNVDEDVHISSVQNTLGAVRLNTYVPNRNMILMSIAAAYAEVEGLTNIVMGFQVTDAHHDTSKKFMDKVNDVLSENHIIKLIVSSPCAHLSKYQEIQLIQELDGNLDLLAHTLTCYNPDSEGKSCGSCPACVKRLSAFEEAGIIDPIAYQTDISRKP